jgi:exosortase A-associated hydrolase 2
MLALQARLLTERGIGVLMVDLYGTGDSSGDFHDARWDIWKGDLEEAVNWLSQNGTVYLNVLGLRLGALLAMDFASQSEQKIERIVLWRPVIDGKTMITQFLRLQLAADLTEKRLQQQSTKGLRETLAQDQSIEVAGYRLAPQLVAGIDGLRIEPLASQTSPPIHWLELVSTEDPALPLASRRVIHNWKAIGVNVNTSLIVGDQFWLSPEITIAPNLLQATLSIFQ